jgi:hypothetical protein
MSAMEVQADESVGFQGQIGIGFQVDICLKSCPTIRPPFVFSIWRL